MKFIRFFIIPLFMIFAADQSMTAFAGTLPLAGRELPVAIDDLVQRFLLGHPLLTDADTCHWVQVNRSNQNQARDRAQQYLTPRKNWHADLEELFRQAMMSSDNPKQVVKLLEKMYFALQSVHTPHAEYMRQDVASTIARIQVAELSGRAYVGKDKRVKTSEKDQALLLKEIQNGLRSQINFDPTFRDAAADYLNDLFESPDLSFQSVKKSVESILPNYSGSFGSGHDQYLNFLSWMYANSKLGSDSLNYLWTEELTDHWKMLGYPKFDRGRLGEALNRAYVEEYDLARQLTYFTASPQLTPKQVARISKTLPELIEKSTPYTIETPILILTHMVENPLFPNETIQGLYNQLARKIDFSNRVQKTKFEGIEKAISLHRPMFDSFFRQLDSTNALVSFVPFVQPAPQEGSQIERDYYELNPNLTQYQTNLLFNNVLAGKYKNVHYTMALPILKAVTQHRQLSADEIRKVEFYVAEHKQTLDRRIEAQAAAGQLTPQQVAQLRAEESKWGHAIKVCLANQNALDPRRVQELIEGMKAEPPVEQLNERLVQPANRWRLVEESDMILNTLTYKDLSEVVDLERRARLLEAKVARESFPMNEHVSDDVKSVLESLPVDSKLPIMLLMDEKALSSK